MTEADARDPMLEQDSDIPDGKLPPRNGDNLPNENKGNNQTTDAPVDDAEHAKRANPGTNEPKIEERSRGYGGRESGGPG